MVHLHVVRWIAEALLSRIVTDLAVMLLNVVNISGVNDKPIRYLSMLN